VKVVSIFYQWAQLTFEKCLWYYLSVPASASLTDDARALFARTGLDRIGRVTGSFFLWNVLWCGMFLSFRGRSEIKGAFQVIHR
jgi:hypothetical protein